MLKEIAQLEPTWEIASFYPAQGRWTVEEYLALEPIRGNQMVEFSNGSIEVLPMPSKLHQRIVGGIYRRLFSFVAERKLGEVLFSPIKVKLWEEKIREPDVIFVENEFVNSGTDQWFTRVALTVEVISPDDPGRDLRTKRREYAQAGIPEYWIVDPRSQEIMVLTLADSRYVVHGVFERGETAQSVLLDGFQVVVEEIFAGL